MQIAAGTAFTPSVCGQELPSGLGQGTMRRFLPALLQPGNAQDPGPPRGYTRSRPWRPRGGGSTDHQAARRSGPPPAATLCLSRELAAPALCLAWEEVYCAALPKPGCCFSKRSSGLCSKPRPFARHWEPRLVRKKASHGLSVTVQSQGP